MKHCDRMVEMEVCVMNFRINGLRAGILTAMLAIGGVSCKRAYYKPVPKEQVPQRTADVVDSLYREGLKIKNDGKYELVRRDTIRFFDAYANNPKKLENTFKTRIAFEKTPINEYDMEWYTLNAPVYIVSENQILEKNNRAYIAIEEYDKLKK